MGVRAEIREEIRKETVTKIHGQPTNQDLTILEKELIAILANIPTTLGGGNHGHAGIIIETEKYLQLTGGITFDIPVNPGIYPTNVAGNAPTGMRARAEAEHKEAVKEYETLQGVMQATKDIILDAVDPEYLLEIEDEILGFLNQTPKDILNHLKSRGGALDFADTKTLLAERDGEWDASEIPQIYFNRVEKAIQGLTRAGITSDLNERRDMALYYFKVTGEFDAAVREWEQKPMEQKTWKNIKTFISTEYAKENRQNKLTARNFKANIVEEQTEVIEELIANLTENHTRQMENLIKSTTEAMKEMMSMIKNDQKTTNQQSNNDRKKKREERQKQYNEAPICKHCGKKHPRKKEDECWELEKNKDTRPINWKSTKTS